MIIERLESVNNNYFDKICDWSYNWWGKANGHSYEGVKAILEHSLCTNNKLPQTYIAILNEEVVGMYQFAMADDLHCRPDLYPWLINVYVDEKHRGEGICEALMKSVNSNAKAVGLNEIYLYTGHKGLYEKYGWKYIENQKTYNKNNDIVRIYKLKIF